MERIRGLTRYQKGILLLMTAMVLAFAAIYAAAVARVGFDYRGTILTASQEAGGTVYAGRIQGRQARFTVSEDRTVEFRYGDQTYGPYTAKEDAAAIPEQEDMAEYMTGVELRRGEEVIFRGGVWDQGDFLWLCDKHGEDVNLGFSVEFSDGTVWWDESGRAIDPMEPSVSDVLGLMAGPRLTHRGDWMAWVVAAFVCAVNAAGILFADELFRWQLSFQIRDADRAEPSDWEMAGRYVAWTVLPVMALASFVMGLR